MGETPYEPVEAVTPAPTGYGLFSIAPVLDVPVRMAVTWSPDWCRGVDGLGSWPLCGPTLGLTWARDPDNQATIITTATVPAELREQCATVAMDWGDGETGESDPVDADGRASATHTYTSPPAAPANALASPPGAGSVAAAGVKTPAGIGWERAGPFLVWAAVECGPFGADPPGLTARARARLVWNEQFQTERAFSGDPAHAPAWATPTLVGDATVLTATPVEFAAAVGLLEERLGLECGAAGVLHLPRRLVATAPPGLLGGDGRRLATTLGTAVAAGTGYRHDLAPGGGPADPGTAWIYGSGPVTVRRGPFVEHRVHDAETNLVYALAERVYAVGVDCGIWAVPIDTATQGGTP